MNLEQTPSLASKAYWLRPRRPSLASIGPQPTATVDDSSLLASTSTSSVLQRIRRPRRTRSLSPSPRKLTSEQVGLKNTPRKPLIAELAIDSEGTGSSSEDLSRPPSPAVATIISQPSGTSAADIVTVTSTALQASAPNYSDLSSVYTFSAPVPSVQPRATTSDSRPQTSAQITSTQTDRFQTTSSYSLPLTSLVTLTTASSFRPPIVTISTDTQRQAAIQSSRLYRRSSSPQYCDMAFSGSPARDHRDQPANTGFVGDALIAPPIFTGVTADQSAERYVEYFERYASFKQLSDRQRADLFCLLMRQGAQDWISTLDPDIVANYRLLLAVFKKQYFRNPNLRWQEASNLWTDTQRKGESVNDFIARLRRNAMHLGLSDQLFQYAILHGLLPQYKTFVLSHNPTSLEQTIEMARLAETCAIADPISSLVMDSVSAQGELVKKQQEALDRITQQLEKLSSQATAPLTTTSASSLSAAVDRDESFRSSRHRERSPSADRRRHRSSSSDRGRDYQKSDSYDRRDRRPSPRQTPQRRQKQLYVRQQNDRRPRQQTPSRRTEDVCYRCGNRTHSDPSRCPAKDQVCNSCGRKNHYARIIGCVKVPPIDRNDG